MTKNPIKEYNPVKECKYRMQYVPEKCPCEQEEGLIIIYRFQGKKRWGLSCCLTDPFMVWFHEIFELSFQKQESYPEKYVLNIEEN